MDILHVEKVQMLLKRCFTVLYCFDMTRNKFFDIAILKNEAKEHWQKKNDFYMEYEKSSLL